MLGHELAHLHVTSVFLVPLATLVVLRFLEGGDRSARGLIVRLGPLLAAPVRLRHRDLLHADALPRRRPRARPARRAVEAAPHRGGGGAARRLLRRLRGHRQPVHLLRRERLPGRDHADDTQPRRSRDLRVPDRDGGDRRRARAALRPFTPVDLGRERAVPRAPGARDHRPLRAHTMAAGREPLPRARARSSPCWRRSARSCGCAATRSLRSRGGGSATLRSSTT